MVAYKDKYRYLIAIEPGLKSLVHIYAQNRQVSFNRALVELLETHPSISVLYEKIVKKHE